MFNNKPLSCAFKSPLKSVKTFSRRHNPFVQCLFQKSCTSVQEKLTNIYGRKYFLKRKFNHRRTEFSVWVSIWSPGENYVGNSRSKSTIKFHVLNSESQRTNSEEKLRDVCATIFLINGSPVKGEINSLLLGV